MLLLSHIQERVTEVLVRYYHAHCLDSVMEDEMIEDCLASSTLHASMLLDPVLNMLQMAFGTLSTWLSAEAVC
jgi:hypothetical protein